MEATFVILTLLSLSGWILLKHSVFAVPLVVFLSLWVQDFFPLSHFPMYSDPDESENYFYLATVGADGAIDPLPVRQLTRITAPKVKKMFKSWADDDAAKLEKSRRDLSPEERRKTGVRLLQFLREQAEDRPGDFPDNVSLVEVWIVYDEETGVSESTEVVATLDGETGQAVDSEGAKIRAQAN